MCDGDDYNGTDHRFKLSIAKLIQKADIDRTIVSALDVFIVIQSRGYVNLRVATPQGQPTNTPPLTTYHNAWLTTTHSLMTMIKLMPSNNDVGLVSPMTRHWWYQKPGIFKEAYKSTTACVNTTFKVIHPSLVPTSRMSLTIQTTQSLYHAL